MNIHSVTNVNFNRGDDANEQAEKLRSLSFLLWIVITITMIVTMPNMDKLVKEKGHITIPNTEQSSIADKMIKEMDKDGTEKYDIIVVLIVTVKQL